MTAKLAGRMLFAAAMLAGAAGWAQDIQVIHPTNTVWTYNDSSISTDNPTLALGTSPRWMDPDYVPVIGNGQNQWKTGGRGLFGNDTSTVYTNLFGTFGNGFRTPLNRSIAAGDSTRVTFYFITKFNWPYTPTNVVLRGTNWLDDGGVVYLNGVEVFRARQNGTPGTIPAWGDTAVNQGAEGVPEPLEYAATSLVTGENTLAVEVHQSSTTSSDLAFTTALRAVLPAVPTNTTPNEPTDRVVMQNRSTTLAIVGDGNPRPTYQWYKDEVAIPDATNASYVIAFMQSTDAGQYQVRLLNEFGSATSRVAQVTYIADGDAPLVTEAVGSANFTEVVISFNELMDPASTAETFSYSIKDSSANEYAVDTVTLSPDGRAVILSHALAGAHPPGTVLTVSIGDVNDKSLNLIVPTNVTLTSWVPGGCSGVVFETYGPLSTSDNNIITTLLASPDYPNKPQDTRVISAFDSRLVYADNNKDGYGARLRGLFIPRFTGSYIFYLGSDDSSRLYLNPNGPAEAGKTMIVEELGCCNLWPDRKSAPQALIAGHGYYLEMIYKEGGGGDYGKVAVRLESEGPPLDDPETVAVSTNSIAGNLVGYLAAPLNVAGPVTLLQQPSSINIEENQPITLNVTATNVSGILCYQWQRSDAGGPFTDILGAVGRTYSIAFPTVATDNGDKYRCIVQAPGASVISDEATLTVVPDTTKPTVVAVHATFSMSNVVVTFSEPVGASAEDTFSYSSTTFAVASAVRDASHTSVILELNAPLAIGSEHILKIEGVLDNSGLTLDTTNVAVRAWVLSRGFALQQLYFDIGSGTVVPDLTGNAKYPNSPDVVAWVPTLEGPTDRYDNYGTRLSGWIAPPIDGNYLFYVCSDDGSQFSLSPNSDPAGLALTAQEMSYNAARVWTGDRTDGTRGTPPSNISTNPVPMTAGQMYAFAMLAKEGGGGDNSGVNWQPPGQVAPANGTPGIAGPHLYSLADPVGASVTVTQQPVSVEAVLPATLSFSVGAASTLLGAPNTNLTYLWQRNNGAGFADILGAYGSTYTVDLTPADAGAQFRVLVFSPGASATSQVVTATSPLRIAATRSGNLIRISWPAPGTGITLETTTTLQGTPPPWTIVPANTYQTDATSVYVEIPAPVGNAFYRLRQ